MIIKNELINLGQNNGILPGNPDFWPNMRVLRLLSRVAFICNICFLLASFIQWIPNPPEGEVISMIIVLGYLLSIFINTLVNVWVLLALLTRSLHHGMIPLWLLIVNGLLFILQIILYILSRS
jgi:hypothetical protein